MYTTGNQKQKNYIQSKEKKKKVRVELNKIENQKSIKKINETKSWLFEEINKINKLLARLIKKRKKKTQITININEKYAPLLIPWMIKG